MEKPSISLSQQQRPQEPQAPENCLFKPLPVTQSSETDPEKQKPVPEPKPPYSAFPKRRKKLILAIVTAAGFLGPLAGSIYLPVLPELQTDFNVSATVINATVSVFMIVFSFAPLMWAAWADFGGRKFLYMISLLIFIATCILLAALPAHIGILFAFRVVQAFGASSVQSLGAGTVADTIEPRKRGSAIAYFMLGPQLGPILGPILGGAISSGGSWRWIFGFLAIIGAVVWLTIFFFLPETLRCLVGDGSVYKKGSWVTKPQLRQARLIEKNDPRYPRPPKPSLRGYLRLMSYAPVTLVSVNAGLLFATYYGLAVTLAQQLKNTYGFTTAQTGAAYLVPGCSLVLGSLSSGRLSDRLRARRKARHPDRPMIPEHRLPIQIFGVLLSMAGILGYGWMVHFKLHVAGVLIFTFLAGFGMTWVFVTNTTYLTECAPGVPASLVAIASFFRNMGAAIASVVIEPLIKRMTFGWCFTGLALIDLFSVTMVVILMVKGSKWRQQLEEKKRLAAQAAKAKTEKSVIITEQPASAATSKNAAEGDNLTKKLELMRVETHSVSSGFEEKQQQYQGNIKK
jgi:MFS family permease